MSNNIYKKQDIYLFKSYTSVSFKPSKTHIKKKRRLYKEENNLKENMN